MNELERMAVIQLHKLAALWPSTLYLFSWSGSLVVARTDTNEIVAYIEGIPNDGGDPEDVTKGNRRYLQR